MSLRSPLLMRLIALAGCAGTALFLVLGKLAPPPEISFARGVLLRLGLVAIATTVLTLGPGLALGRVWGWSPRVGLGALPVPGFLVLALTGLAAWLLSHLIPPATTVRILLGLVTVALAVAAAWPGKRSGIELDRAAALILLLLVLIAVGRDLYSLGPPGELLAGTISRTYEASNRPDSRISYNVVQLIANGLDPNTPAGRANFMPYWFGARGPLTGLMSAPIVLGAGARVPVAPPNQPWEPFDPQGFAAYRLAMEIFAAASLLSVFGLVRSLLGREDAIFALVLVATTPFVVHEVYFTWPKLLTGGLLLLAGHQLLLRRSVRSAASTGLAYLAHPMALLSVPALGLLALLVRWRRERRVLLTAAALAAYGLVVVLFVAAWQLVNRGEPSQLGFIGYVTGANSVPATSVSDWLGSRGQSIADTLVPMFLFFVHRYDPNANPVGGPIGSRLVIFFLQYWTSLPFASGILFYPLLLWGLGKAMRRDPLMITSVVILPFVLFLVYWGSYDTGLMREGLQPWMLTILVVYAWVRGVTGWRAPLERWVLLTRIPETFLMIVLSAILSHHRIISGSYPTTDRAGLLAMVVGLGGLGIMVWRASGRRASRRSTDAVATDPEVPALVASPIS